MAGLDEITQALNLLHPDGGVRNLRVLRHRGGMDSYWSKKTDKLGELIGTIDPDSDVRAIFVQLQEINRNELNIQAGDGVKRIHIGRYIWFEIDVDTLRPNKSTSNATDEEKVQSWETVKEIHRFLRELGWPPAVICDSGNGWHLLWRVDLAFDPTLDKWDPSFLLVQRCLTALARKFNNDVAEICDGLMSPEQLKAWGTRVRASGLRMRLESIGYKSIWQTETINHGGDRTVISSWVPLEVPTDKATMWPKAYKASIYEDIILVERYEGVDGIYPGEYCGSSI